MPTVKCDDEGHREGFLDNRVTMTKAAAREPAKGMAGFQEADPDTKAGGNPAHPEFKSGGKMPSVPEPFSKTTIKGGPAKPGTPA